MSAGRNKHSKDSNRKNQRKRALMDRLQVKIDQKIRREAQRQKNERLKANDKKEY